MTDKKALPKRKQARDWAKLNAAKMQREAKRDEELSLLVKHHNELLARFYGKPAFTSEVANKVNAELSAQLIGEYR